MYDNQKSLNPFLQFYGQHNISPVHQNVTEELEYYTHLLRREKLYRMLGLPPVAFFNRNVLEIGPGGGVNSLAFFAWRASVDFVEPNPKAQEELLHLMKEKKIEDKRWKLFQERIESFEPDQLYDVVVAEGFIPGINNRQDVVEKIERCLKPGGVVVITCVDDVSIFCECLKRIVATQLTWEIDNIADKINVLVRAFSSHLAYLKHASRPVEDWVTDMFLNPAFFAQLFAIDDCLNEMMHSYDFMGSSPALFTDYSWYKDMEQNRNELILEQFYQKRHTLLLSDLPESIRPVEENEKLFQAMRDLRSLLAIAQDNFAIYIPAFIRELGNIRSITNNIDIRITEAIDETCALLMNPNLCAEHVGKAEKLAAAFGRGQQYVSMVKKYEYYK